MVELKKYAEGLDPKDLEKVAIFVDMVIKETEGVLAALSGLEDEIQELEAQQQKAQDTQLTLHDLEEKFQKHFQELREKADGVK